MNHQTPDEVKVESLVRKWVKADDQCNRWFMWPGQRARCNEATVDAMMESYEYFKDVFANTKMMEVEVKKK